MPINVQSYSSVIPSEKAYSKGLNKFAQIAIFFGVFLGAFVSYEPAPYELYMIVVALCAFFLGMRIPKAILPLIILVILYLLGGLVSAFIPVKLKEPAMYIAVTGFLCLTALFFACYSARFPVERLQSIFLAWTAGAFFTAVIGILGYFNVFGLYDYVTLYGRARGAFQDPNVFGPFLILPITWLVCIILTKRQSLQLIVLPVLGVLLLGVFLSFSRGAWAHCFLSVAMSVYFLFCLQNSTRIRMRVILAGIFGALILSGLFAYILTIPEIADLFKERASLSQSYDTGPTGRFGRQVEGFILGLQNPLGIGATRFVSFFPEEPHNVYLNAMVSHGWLGFFAYVTLILLTLFYGFKVVLSRKEWQFVTIPLFSTFFVLCLLGFIIDTDRWRHFFLLLGLLWGVIAADHKIRGQNKRMSLASQSEAVYHRDSSERSAAW